MTKDIKLDEFGRVTMSALSRSAFAPFDIETSQDLPAAAFQSR